MMKLSLTILVLMVVVTCSYTPVDGQEDITSCIVWGSASTCQYDVVDWCPTLLTFDQGLCRCNTFGRYLETENSRCVYDCGNLRSPINGAVDTSDGTITGSVAKFTCNTGHVLFGSESLMCEEGVGWNSTSPYCFALTGRPMTDPNDYCNSVDICQNGAVCRNDNTSVLCTCPDGFTGFFCEIDIAEFMSSQCLYSNYLKDRYNCSCPNDYMGSNCTPGCDPPPAPVNGHLINASTEYNEYDKIQLACDTGYTQSGASSDLFCYNRTWLGSGITCNIVDCGIPPAISNGNVIHDSNQTTYQATAKLICVTGYSIAGASSITCLPSGLWSTAVGCQQIDCGSPSIGNSIAITPNGTKFGESGIVICNQGFTVTGNASITCLENGNWSKLPECALQIEGLPFQFGLSDDNIFSDIDDYCSEKIYFSPGIPIFERTFTDIYVCSNGIVSFGVPMSTPAPEADLPSRTDVNILAPFFADVLIKGEGRLFYRYYDILNKAEQLKSKEVEQYEERVTSFFNISNFKTQFILVVTWYRVCSTGLFVSNQEATFQLVLASDVLQTFVSYSYATGRMNWIYYGSNPKVFVGHVFSNDRYSYPFSFTNAVLKMDENAGTRGRSGFIMKQLTLTDGRQTSGAAECLRWYSNNIKLNEEIKQDAVNLPECPCDRISLLFDPLFAPPREISPGIVCTTALPSKGLPRGKTCCYNALRVWTDEKPFAGGLELYHPAIYPNKHDIYDSIPKENCCQKSNLCHLYYELHPVGSCYSFPWLRIGSFWGDPHFLTLDGLRFTFNGLGEYILLKLRTIDIDFELQARTTRAERSDGTLANATVFSAFAVKANDISIFHVELNASKTGLVLYGNGVDLSIEFERDEDFKYIPQSNNTLVMERRNSSLIVFFPTTGVSLNVSVGVNMLTMIISVPTKYRNLTKGLMGNFDGIAENDFITPSGSVLLSNITEWEIYQYGQLWEIDAKTPALRYGTLENHSTYHNASYVPRFLGDNKSASTPAVHTCGTTKEFECIFDYLTAGEAVAINTLSVGQTVEYSKAEINKTVPQIKGCSQLFVSVDSPAVCPVSVVNGNVVNFQLINGSNNAYFNQSIQSLVINLSDLKIDQITISVVGSSDNGRISPEFRPSVLVCTGCNGHGKCLQQERDGSKAIGQFKFAVCECEHEYEGEDCEQDFNGCASSPCSQGRKCSDLKPDEQSLQSRSYSCSPCPNGFEDNGHKCKDIDECSVSNGYCGHICTNTEGSFECGCKEGYMTDPDNESGCIDINECDRALHNCTHECVNTDGGYNCSCKPGYSMKSFPPKCFPEGNVSESCLKQGINCSNTAGCSINKNGEPTCFCELGYTLDNDGTSCKDIDECKFNICSQNCNNLNGSFECSCYPGYRLEGKIACKACEIPFYGENCEERCNCTDPGALKCDPVSGCVCHTGWDGDKCDRDVNECEVMDAPCSDLKKECENLMGSYRCKCRPGYRQDNIGKCTDVNECLDPLLNNCVQTCQNVDGGFVCTCQSGYSMENNVCVDIDECRLRTDGCEQICENVEGHYNCYCEYGYVLNKDRRTCTKNTDDICRKERNLNCSHFCSVTKSDVFCSCRNGYRIGTDNQTCIDENECENTISNGCKGNATCKNTPGSYQCDCPTGSKLENDGRTCSGCDGYHYGKNCSQTCSQCLNGVCDRLTGCVCSLGWIGINCDTDLNECENDTNVCTGQNRECVNTIGSYTCRCTNGYKDTNGTCEKCTDNHFGRDCAGSCNCSITNVRNVAQMCDTISGKCFCKENWQGVTCDSDVNECADQSKCNNLQNVVCHNTKGGYICDCRRNFENGSSNICVPKINTTNMPSGPSEDGIGMVKTKIIIKNVSLPEGYNLDSETGYGQIAEQINRSMVEFYRKFTEWVKQIVVTDIRSGSLIVDYIIMYNKTNQEVKDALIASAIDILHGVAAFTFSGEVVDVSLGNGIVTPCDILIDYFGPCEDGSECALLDNKPSCREIPNKGFDKIVIIIAVTTSGGVLLILVSVACCIVLRKRSNAKKTQGHRN